MNDYSDLTPKEQIAARIADAPYRCDACSECVMSVRPHDLPGGTRFLLCGDCADLHSAVPVREEVKV